MSRTIGTRGFISSRLIHLSPVVRYGIAVVAVEAATFLHLALNSIGDLKIPYIVFYPAVLISAWFGGLLPGLLSIGCTLAVDYFLLNPQKTVFLGNPANVGGMLVFIAVGVVVSALNQEWRNAELTIADSEEHLRVTLTSIGDAVITTDESGTVTHLNAVAQHLTGWTAVAGVKQPVDQVFVIIDERTRHRATNPIERVVMEGVPCALSSNTLLISRDGRKIPIDHSAAPIKTKDGRTAGVIIVFRDITLRRLADQERATLHEKESAARRQAEEANRAKDEFLAMLSHELRTPLSAILGWAAILKSKELTPEKAAHAIDVIERNARVEAHLVESLLDLSRIIAGKLKLAMEPVDLSYVVMATVDALRPMADAKGVILDAGPFDSRIVIDGDSGRLQQIFSNLLSNAIKFTPPDGHVHVQLTCSSSKAQIEIIDDGEGISSEFLPYIFDRFRQANSGPRRSYGGLGLGLAIVRELVHAHGGTVVATSMGIGQGSTFTVTVPLPAGLQPKFRVLIVDDIKHQRIPEPLPAEPLEPPKPASKARALFA
jgi:PAS domain S-box-containing protein